MMPSTGRYNVGAEGASGGNDPGLAGGLASSGSDLWRQRNSQFGAQGAEVGQVQRGLPIKF
jgi:hypothetical protein